ncbi:MAG: sulfatase-like hydrolase/transferase [Solirubrobacterales bacterium]|nr:sulfatase-like hydrolase/transferase [Solirubrobacterales bacterium]
MSKESKAVVRPPRPSLLLGAAHLAALWAIAILQPMLSLLGDNPDFFVARDNTGTEIVIFALALAFVPPLIALAIEALAQLIDRNLRWWIHLSFVGLLAAVIVLRILKGFADGPASLMILAALAGGAALAWAYGHKSFVRSVSDFLTPAPVIILVIFIFFSSSADVIRPADDSGALDVTVPNPHPVVMVIFDEFPVGSLMTSKGKVNSKRFPHFAELEKSSNWYRNTVTGASFTSAAVPSIMTGKEADGSLLATSADQPESIFTLLGGSYRVHATETVTNLCPPEVCTENQDRPGTFAALSDLAGDLKYVQAHLILPESMSSRLPDVSQSFEDFGGSAQTTDPAAAKAEALAKFKSQFKSVFEAQTDTDKALADFLDELDPAPEKTLDLLHIEKPHYPWTHYPSGLSYTEDQNEFRFLFNLSQWLDDGYPTERARQAHLLEVGFTDYILGRIMDQVKAGGYWDDTEFVVVADHGGAMNKGFNRREARPETMGEIAMVPLFIKAPGQTDGRIVNRPTCTTEIVPIVAGHLGVDLPWKSPACDRKKASIINVAGPAVSSPMGTVIRQRDEYVGTLASLFGGDTGWASVFRLGPNQDLIGRTTDAVGVSPSPDGASASPEESGAAVTDFEPNVPLNPVLRQRGTLEGVREGTPLAVSVNGRIAAVGQSFDDHGRRLYSILLPQDSLKSGENEVAVYRVSRDSGKPGLTELWSSADQ